jgi:predicted MFS family arabinose efflux permease
MPPTYSLVGDYFPLPAERTRAMAIYWLASPLATLISFIVGGWLNEMYGWRIAFFAMGLPALPIALLVKMTIVEPRVALARENHLKASPPRMRSVLLTLWAQHSSRHLSIGLILIYTLGAGLAPWYAAFMMRSHRMGTGELGLWMGLLFGVSGILGILLGGFVAARWFGNNEQGQMRLSALMTALLVPCFALFLLAPQKQLALFALMPFATMFSFFVGPTFALMQRLVVPEMRATTLAVVMLLANLIGMGIGPQIVGIVSDLLAPALGLDSLRYAMLGISSVAFWAAYHFWTAGRTVKADLSQVVGQIQITEEVESPNNLRAVN